MKKKLIVLMLSMSMTAALVSGCGSTAETAVESTATETVQETATEAETADAESDQEAADKVAALIDQIYSMIADVLHGRGDDRLHVGRTVIPARLTVRVVLKLSGACCKLYLLTEEIELIMLRQTKMLCGSIRKSHIDSGIDGSLTCLTDLSFFRKFQFIQRWDIWLRRKDFATGIRTWCLVHAAII